MSNQPLALEYHGKAQAEGHWRRGQELIDALAYIDPLTPDVKHQVDKLIEEEMRKSTKRPADYVKEMPAIRPARFEGHHMLQQEYERVRAMQPMQPLDVTRYRLDPPPTNKKNDHAAWLAATNNAHAQLEHQLNRIANLELLVKYGANAWRAQTVFDETLLKQLEGTLQGLRKSIDQLNRERKLQQQSAGAELRVLEDHYYSALRKNLEINAACQAVEEEMQLLEAKMGRIDQKMQARGQQQQQLQQDRDNIEQRDRAREQENGQQQETAEEGPQQQQEAAVANGIVAAAADSAGPTELQQNEAAVAAAESPVEQQQQGNTAADGPQPEVQVDDAQPAAQEQPEAAVAADKVDDGPADMEQ